MQGLSPPRLLNFLDDVLDIGEDVMKKFMFEYRKAALRDLANITGSNKPAYGENIINIAKIKFQEFALTIKDPLTKIIKEICLESSKLEIKRPLDSNIVLFPLKQNIQQLDSNAKKQNKNILNIVQNNERAIHTTELRFDRLNAFLSYPKDVRGVKQLQLDLDSQSIGDSGIHHFSKMLSLYSGCRSLILNLATNSITQKGAEILGDAFIELKNLQCLNINLYNNKIKHKGMNGIFTKIAKNCKLLKELNVELACNQIGTNGMIDLGEHILNLRCLDKLWLGLYDNQIFEEGMKYFLNSFSKFPTFSTLRVDLRLNPIQKIQYDKLKTCIKDKKITNSEIIF